MKTQDFYDFLKEVNLPNSEKHYLLIDNLKVYHAIRIKELLVSKNIEYLLWLHINNFYFKYYKEKILFSNFTFFKKYYSRFSLCACDSLASAGDALFGVNALARVGDSLFYVDVCCHFFLL